MTRAHITPEQWSAARNLSDAREAAYVRLKAEEWSTDVYHALSVGQASWLLTARPKPIDQRVACHVVAYLASMGFDATWYLEQDGLRVYWGVPPAGQAPTRHHQHALVSPQAGVATQRITP
jgi:hypothetical protein